MSDVQYYEIIERNEIENEIWSFFVPIRKNVSNELIQLLIQFINTSEHFSVGQQGLTKMQVELIVNLYRDDDDCYMKRFNIIEPENELTEDVIKKFLPPLPKGEYKYKDLDATEYTLDIYWYKGNISFIPFSYWSE